MVITKKSKYLQSGLTYLVLICFSVFCLFPFIWMVITALKPSEEVRSTTPSFLIKNPTLENFQHLILNTGFLTYFKNSLFVGLAATILALVFSVFSAYALSRFMRFKGVKLVSVTMILSQMVPPVLLLVPLYIIMMQLGFLNTHIALIVAYTTFTIPLCTFMLTSFFSSIPEELEEAAEIDGCSKIGMIWRVILPISIPGLVSTSLFAFVNAWNEFMFGYVFINDDSLRTLTPGLSLFKGLYTTDWGSIMSASVMSVLPVVILFLYLQKYLVEGMTAGAVKG
jgi:multiple sugar transport system permease protein